MIIILNYLPWLVLGAALGGMIFFASKQRGTAALVWFFACALLFITLQALTPSYMPKGTEQQLDNPGFEESEAGVKDNLRSPSEATQSELDKKLDWKQQVKNNKETDEH